MIFWRIFLWLGFIAFYVNAGVIGTIQGITVTGRLSCGNKSVRDVEIQLWEEDSDKFLFLFLSHIMGSCDPDDLLNSTISDAKGNFQVYGEDKEVTAIEPYLSIAHNCDNGYINEYNGGKSQEEMQPIIDDGAIDN
uniref:Transthyretin-like family protein n=1 Tax=Loa loa TaxID=7209 RepID=A0A1I7W3T2_LOALO